MIYIIKHYYWFTTLVAILLMLGKRDFSFVLIIATIYVFLKSLKTIKWKDIDTIVAIFIIYSLVSFLFSDYDFSLFYFGIKLQVVPIFFYYIARGKYFKDSSFFDNIKYPLVFVYISAIFLYFFPPAWYLEYKTANITADMSDHMIHEFTRMSSFWSHPYFVGYSSVIFMVYMMNKIVYCRDVKSYDLIYIILTLICVFFSQMRICIFFLFLLYLYLTIYSVKNNLRIRKYLLSGWVLLSFISVFIYFVIINYLDSSFIDYIKYRSVDSDENIIAKRFGLFSDFLKNISLLGEGLGKYGHSAILLNMPSIADCEYIRLPVELGIMGFFNFMFIILFALFRGFNNVKKYCVETFVVSFYLLAMIGATPLEMTVQQPFMFWFCIGHLMNKTV